MLDAMYASKISLQNTLSPLRVMIWLRLFSSGRSVLESKSPQVILLAGEKDRMIYSAKGSVPEVETRAPENMD